MKDRGFANIFIGIAVTLIVIVVVVYLFFSRQSVTPLKETESPQPTTTVYGGGDTPVTFTVTVPQWTRPEDKIFLNLKTDCFIDEGLECDLPMVKIDEHVWQVTYRENFNDGGVIYRYNRNAGGDMTEEIVGEKDDLTVWRTYSFSKRGPVELKDTVKNWRWLRNPKPTAKLSDFRPTNLPPRDEPFIVGIELPDWYRKAFEPWVKPTISRIREKGFNWIGFVYNYIPGSPQFEEDAEGTNLQVALSKVQDLRMLMIVPIEAVGYDEREIRNPHSDEWHKKFVDSWKNTALNATKFAHTNGIEILMVENQWAFFEYTSDAQKQLVNSLVKEAFREINNFYTGRLSTVHLHTDSPWDYYSEVDVLGVGSPGSLTDSFNPTVAGMKDVLERGIDEMEVQSKRFGKPVIAIVSVSSYDGAAGGQKNIHFESPEVYEIYSDNPNYPADFQEQADAYEALFQAVYDESFIIGVFPFSYKYWDLHDKSPSIRDKPAEEVWIKWAEVFKKAR